MKKSLALNTVTPIILEAVSIISGFVIPRMILEHYGSNVNGLTQSIGQFLSFITFTEMGVGSVIQYNLYKPLADGDKEQISKIVVSSSKFFQNIAKALVVYTAILMLVYPFLHSNQFGHVYNATLIVAMSISFFSQYYFGQTNQLLLSADQRGYIHYLLQIVTVTANMVVCVILIKQGAGIHYVKLATSLIYLLRPAFLQLYVSREYKIDYGVKYDVEPIQQKWNGIAQHISAVVLDNTDIIVLTIFSTLSNVSIYSTYYMIVSGIKRFITTAVAGIQAKLGDIIARGETKELQELFDMAEWTIHSVAVLLFSCTCVLIVPFVSVYTKGITDTEYILPFFGMLITIANALHSLRLPYSCIILSGGHYKQTQVSYIAAAVINVASSIVLVCYMGLIGVVIGTVISMTFQTIWMAYYTYANILKRAIGQFWRQIFVDALCFSLVTIISKLFSFNTYSYVEWIILALKTLIVALIVTVGINLLFYRNKMKHILRVIK